jgi:hypothetical protein
LGKSCSTVLWKPTSKHKKLRTDITHNNIFKGHYTDNKRICGSFEYVGDIYHQI